MEPILGPSFFDEKTFALYNRAKNLAWTVSGNYQMEFEPNLDMFRRSKDIALYESVKQGAMNLFYDADSIALYIAKKLCMGGEQGALMDTVQVSVEGASSKKLFQLRAGVSELRSRAFSDILEYDFEKLSKTFMGRVKLYYARQELTGMTAGEKSVRDLLDDVRKLDGCTDTDQLIAAVDGIYNKYVDKSFTKRGITLEDVLAVTMEEIAESPWAQFLKEEADEKSVEEAIKDVAASVTHFSDLENAEEKKGTSQTPGVILFDEESLARMESYVEQNYGKTYMSGREEAAINRALCKGTHDQCRLYFTEGILHGGRQDRYPYKYAHRQLEKNMFDYYDNNRTVKKNIAVLTDIIKKSLVMRDQIDYTSSESGTLIPSRLWRVGRSRTDKLFQKANKEESSDFVVDIMIDASGSQKKRQGKVAMQAYIISEALSATGIPHRIMSFCTFWNYTILHRFRDYDDPRDMNNRVFEYTTSANNRDGLAIKAAVEHLLKRREENKILIVLSDGRPYDVVAENPDRPTPPPYFGKRAQDDAAFEVRRARNCGIAVLGVFAGHEEDLPAEKVIFGKDFAYIRDIRSFSDIVGKYLKRHIDV